MKAESIFVNTSELSQPGLDNSPEVFYSIDMVFTHCKFIFPMLDPVMTAISEIHKAILCLKIVSVKYLIPLRTMSEPAISCSIQYLKVMFTGG